MDIKFKQKNKIENPLQMSAQQKELMEEQAEVKRLWSLSTEMTCESCGEKYFVDGLDVFCV